MQVSPPAILTRTESFLTPTSADTTHRYSWFLYTDILLFSYHRFNPIFFVQNVDAVWSLPTNSIMKIEPLLTNFNRTSIIYDDHSSSNRLQVTDATQHIPSLRHLYGTSVSTQFSSSLADLLIRYLVPWNLTICCCHCWKVWREINGSK